MRRERNKIVSGGTGREGQICARGERDDEQIQTKQTNKQTNKTNKQNTNRQTANKCEQTNVSKPAARRGNRQHVTE